MIRRGVQIQLLVFLLITVLGVSYVGAPLRRAGRASSGVGYMVTADFAESGGIFSNAEVTYRGVPSAGSTSSSCAATASHVDLRHRRGARRSRTTRSPSSRTGRRSASSTSTCSRARPARPVPRRRRRDRRRQDTASRCTPRPCCSTSTSWSTRSTSATWSWSSTSWARRSPAPAGPAAAARLGNALDPGRGEAARDGPADRGRPDRAGYPGRLRPGDQELRRRPGPARDTLRKRPRPAQDARQAPSASQRAADPGARRTGRRSRRCSANLLQRPGHGGPLDGAGADPRDLPRVVAGGSRLCPATAPRTSAWSSTSAARRPASRGTRGTNQRRAQRRRPTLPPTPTPAPPTAARRARPPGRRPERPPPFSAGRRARGPRRPARHGTDGTYHRPTGPFRRRSCRLRRRPAGGLGSGAP